MPVTYTESVSTEVRAVLARKGMRQWELAVELGWSQIMLSRRMSGKVAWSTADLEAIAAALSIPLHELVSPKAS